MLLMDWFILAQNDYCHVLYTIINNYIYHSPLIMWNLLGCFESKQQVIQRMMNRPKNREWMINHKKHEPVE